MTVITAEALTDSIAAAARTAGPLKADAAWLWIDGHWPTRLDRDRPTRPRPAVPVVHDPDAVPGGRYDLGLGNDRARTAHHHAAALVAGGHRLAGLAVAHWTGRHPAPARGPAHPADFDRLVDSTMYRLAWLVAHGVTTAPGGVRARAHGAAGHLVEAHGVLSKVLVDVDRTGMLPAARRCRNPLGCDNAPRADGPAGQGVLCEACHKWAQRHDGQPRPPRRWLSASNAKRRRVERGEDFGMAPAAPTGRYVDGVWEPARRAAS